MMLNRRAITFSIASIFLLSACQTYSANNKTQSLHLINYGKSQQPWLTKLHKLNKGENVKFRILQIGDSHTAGDYFTDELRTSLQQKWGNGGIGWVYPNAVAGQRSASMTYQGSGWKTLTSRRDSANFPLGGVVARSQNANMVTLSPRNAVYGEQNITLSVHPIVTQYPLTIIDGQGKSVANIAKLKPNVWQHISFKAQLPLSYQAKLSDVWELGYINIENKLRGVVVSAMGINGAKFTQWDNWNPHWAKDMTATKADLVILSYGTNEAFNEKLNIQETEQYWHKQIKAIRKALPNAGIMIIGAPESLISTQGLCGNRPPMLETVQKLQQRIAKKEKTLYWSWQKAMGGTGCDMKIWIAKGFGKKDGIHFSAQGYQNAAHQLAQAIIKMAQ